MTCRIHVYMATVLVWLMQWVPSPTSLHQFVAFRGPPIDQMEIDTILSTPGRTIKWYGGWPSPVLIIAVSGDKLALTMNCTVFPHLSDKDKINAMIFQITAGSRSPREFRIKETSAFKRFHREKDLHGLRMTYTYSRRKGAVFRLEGSSTPFVGQLSCKAVNRRGATKTNSLHIIDRRNSFSNGVSIHSAGDIKVDEEKSFSCGLRSLDSIRYKEYTFILPGMNIQWRYCSHARYQDCRKAPLVEELAKLLKWPVQVSINGSLYWPYVPQRARTQLQGKSLLCSIHGQPLTFYNKLKFKSSQSSSNERKGMRFINMNRKVLLFDSKQYNTTLPCHFNIGEREFSMKWYWQAKKHSKIVQLIEGYNSQKNVFVEGHKLIFVDPFTEATRGIYQCSVKWTAHGKPRIEVGYYIVETSGFPKIVENISGPKIIEVMDGDDALVPCNFQPFQRTEASVEILGEKSHSIGAINNKYRSVMHPIRMYVTKKSRASGSNLTYSTFGMKYLRRASDLTSSHFVTCIGQGSWCISNCHSVRQQVILVATPRIKFTQTPAGSDCSSCPCLRHIFLCEVSSTSVDEQRKMTVEIKWFLVNDKKVTQELRDEKNEVLIEPMDKRSILKLLRNRTYSDSRIRCVVKVKRTDGKVLTKALETAAVIPCSKMRGWSSRNIVTFTVGLSILAVLMVIFLWAT